LVLEDLDLSRIGAPYARECIVRLLNLVEKLAMEVRTLQEENQRLRDEIARLKGEKGKPDIKANAPKPPAADYSSERERHTPKGWSKGSKTAKIQIDREQTLRLDPAKLPPDAEFKDFEDVVVQDVIFKTDNVLFHKEKYYSRSEGRSYLAETPRGYEGQFGPGIKSLAIVLYFGSNMSEPKIAELLRSIGVEISDGEMSNLLIKEQGTFHEEKDSLFEAGLASTPWQHLDQTGTRVAGQNQHCQIVCNPLYTAYRTTETKGRLSVLDTLRNGRPRLYLLNEEAGGYLGRTQMSKVAVALLKAGMPHDKLVDEPTMKVLLAGPLAKLGPQQQRWALDATAVAAYHAETGYPMVRMLLCDGAAQFTWITEELSLCWVHEGRHYKMLTPYVAHHRELLEGFLTRFWGYYRELLAYQAAPSSVEALRLSARFDELFATVTLYQSLDATIAKTRDKKDSLLKVLSHPEIELHNNPAELGARARVRKRDVSFGPRTPDGMRAWDTFMSLAESVKKLGVSFFDYVHDRILGTNLIPRLDTLLTARAATMRLSPSWIKS
jgi:Transposase IS66 family